MTPPATTWKLTLSYDGTPFCGWQVQPGRATIQGTLSDTVFRITGERVLPQGSGRTDAGVHALAQVASFSLAAPIPPANLLRALNRALPASIRILAAEPAPPTFHARHSALRKTYEYRIFESRLNATSTTQPASPPPYWRLASGHLATESQLLQPTSAGGPFMDGLIASVWSDATGGPFTDGLITREWQKNPERICPPFLAPFVCDCRWPLDLDLMQRAAAHLLGTHDFTSFAASDPDLTHRAASTTTSREPEPTPNPIKTIFTSIVTHENGLLLYRVTGSGFLHHMVRNLAGILIEIGRGALSPEDIPRILAARNRSAAGPTAPARGLFLVSVDYPPQEIPQPPPTSEAAQ